MEARYSTCNTTYRRTAMEARITYMSDRVIRQELECKKGVNIL